MLGDDVHPTNVCGSAIVCINGDMITALLCDRLDGTLVRGSSCLAISSTHLLVSINPSSIYLQLLCTFS